MPTFGGHVFLCHFNQILIRQYYTTAWYNSLISIVNNIYQKMSQWVFVTVAFLVDFSGICIDTWKQVCGQGT